MCPRKGYEGIIFIPLDWIIFQVLFSLLYNCYRFLLLFDLFIVPDDGRIVNVHHN